MSVKPSIEFYLFNAQDAIETFSRNHENIVILKRMSAVIANCFANKKMLLCCGNGGSACDAMHFAEEFSGRFKKDRPALPALALTDPGFLTCVGNDYGYDNVFMRGVQAYANVTGVLVAISTSGNSNNVIKAVEEANLKGIPVLLFIGKDGGELKGKGTLEILVENFATERIQEIHMLCLHILVESVENILFPDICA